VAAYQRAEQRASDERQPYLFKVACVQEENGDRGADTQEGGDEERVGLVDRLVATRQLALALQVHVGYGRDDLSYAEFIQKRAVNKTKQPKSKLALSI
jgi:hypothetical protein